MSPGHIVLFVILSLGLVSHIKSAATAGGTATGTNSDPSQGPAAASNKQESSNTQGGGGPEVLSTRDFPECTCLQKIRTSFITNTPCGQAAICYWEMYNYRRTRAKINGTFSPRSKEETCGMYMFLKYLCLVGYPPPPVPDPSCLPGLQKCEKELAKLLYDDCEPIRQKRGLPRPEEIQHRVKTEDMIYNLNYDQSKKFQPGPDPQRPTFNNFYAISCPMIYKFPHFTIDLILKDLQPNITYDETLGLIAAASNLPQYIRIGMDNERKVNFHAMSVQESQINWCNIPRNYVCVRDVTPGLEKTCADWKWKRRLIKYCDKENMKYMPVKAPRTPIVLGYSIPG